MANKRSNGSSVKKLDERLKALENMVDKTIENKCVDKKSHPNGVYTNISTSGYTSLAFFEQPGHQGPDSDERIANNVTLMSQHWRGNITVPGPGVTTEAGNQVRVLIVEAIDFTSITDLQLVDVLEYGNYAVDGNLVFTSPYKRRGAENLRYRVCYDKLFRVNTTTKQYGTINYRRSYGSKTNPGKVLEFAGTTQTYPTNHRMVMLAISDSGSLNHPGIVWNCRSIYKDA